MGSRQTRFEVEMPTMHAEYVRQVAYELDLSLAFVIRRAVERLMITRPVTDSDELNQQIADWIAKGNLV